MVVASPPPVVSFARLPTGWHRFGGIGGAYATSWAYRPNSRGWAPAMPRDATVVRDFFPTTATRYSPLKLVLPRKPATLLEGTRDTPEYRIRGRTHGRNVEVWVDIRRRHPTRAELRAAQDVVAAIRFS
jgi:hypothetical protein